MRKRGGEGKPQRRNLRNKRTYVSREEENELRSRRPLEKWREKEPWRI